ncbi:TniQ family protein [Pseudomonas sp. S1Bt23]|nr:TniQ family protein [Pseudomonas sp. S1Bt23]WPO48690.1 TniQ family protein [Pseudomonas sp. S1Bt23]
MMRSNAHFGGLLKPVPQEAFSAWLGRGGCSRNPAPFMRASDCLKQSGVEDFDGEFTNALTEELSEALGLSSECLRRSFPLPGNWLKAPPERRLQFCELCLLHDFRCGRHPSLRITWFYWWLSVCPVHSCPLHTGDSISASEALFSFIQFNSVLKTYMQPPSDRFVERQRRARLTTISKLKFMAWHFQRWYLASVQRGTVIIGDVELAANVAEVELLMADMLAIIGKKRSYPFDRRSYIAELLDIKSWCSLRLDLPPDMGSEPFLGLDVGEHSSVIRMAMFALLGLFLKLPQSAHIWYLGSRGPYDWSIEYLWRSLLYDAVRVPSYSEWFSQQSESWSAPIRTHFRYLLENPSHVLRPLAR